MDIILLLLYELCKLPNDCSPAKRAVLLVAGLLLLLLRDSMLARRDLDLSGFSTVDELLDVLSDAEVAAAAFAFAAAAALTLVLGPHFGQLALDCSIKSLFRVLHELVRERPEQPVQMNGRSRTKQRLLSVLSLQHIPTNVHHKTQHVPAVHDEQISEKVLRHKECNFDKQSLKQLLSSPVQWQSIYG